MSEPHATDLQPISPFTPTRLQTLSRLGAYVLVFEYLVILFFSVLPFSGDSNRLFAQINAALSTSSLPLIAMVLLFAGFCTGARVARWEWWLGRRLRPLLMLVALLYLLTVPALWWLGHSIQTKGDRQIQQQFATVLDQLRVYSGQVQSATSSPALRRLVEAQPQLRLSLQTSESPFASPAASLAQQQAQTLRLIDRIRANLQAEGRARRSAAASELRKEELRISALALAHSLFFALAALIWPSLNAHGAPSP